MKFDHTYYIKIFINPFVDIFLPWLAAVIIMSLILITIFLVTHRQKKVSDRNAGDSWLIFGFGVLGGVVGISTGASLSPVVGTILPALLTFLTALLAYIFSKETLKKWHSVIPFCLTNLLLISMYMTFVGTQLRKEHNEDERKYTEWLLLHKQDLDLKKAQRMKYIKDGEKLNFYQVNTQE